MAVASITRLRLRSAWFLPAFVWHSLSSMVQAKRADGCLAVTANRRGQSFWTLSFWTLSVWRDQAALKAFMLNGPHRTAMPHLVEWCDEAATARMNWNSETLPTWEDAEWHMATEGRLSPVKHPSPAHVDGKPLGEEGLKATIQKPVPLQY